METKLSKSKLKNLMILLVKHFTLAQLSSSAATLAYYTLLSVFPALLVIGNLLPMIGINAHTVLAYLQTLVPAAVYTFIKPLILDFLQRGSGGVLTTGAVIALWSTSQGIAAFQRSVNHAYGIAENQNPIINRVVSFIWMIVVLVIIFVVVFLYGVGEQFLKWLQPLLNFNRRYIYLFSSLKWPITFTIIFIALTLLYYFVPNAKVGLRFAAVGALLVSIFWLWLSKLFGLYTLLFAHGVIGYKTIGAFIAMMVWLDFSGYLIMMGAALNAALQENHDGKLYEKEHFWQLVKTEHNDAQQEIVEDNQQKHSQK